MRQIPWSHIKGIIFDMDGVLVDTEPLNVEAERTVCQCNGLIVSDAEWQNLKGKTNRDVFLHLLKAANRAASEELLTKLITEKRTLFLEIARERAEIIPGSLTFARHSRERYDKIGLTTSSSAPVQRYLCKRFGFSQLMDVVVTGEDVTQGKPHPEPYLLTARRLVLEPHTLCVIEDSLNGVQSALAAGCYVVGIATSYVPDELRRAGAHQVVESFPELQRLQYV